MKRNQTKFERKCLMLNSLELECVRMKTKLMNENKESLNNYLPSFILLFFPKGTTPISIINNSSFPRGETTLSFLLNINFISQFLNQRFYLFRYHCRGNSVISDFRLCRIILCGWGGSNATAEVAMGVVSDPKTQVGISFPSSIVCLPGNVQMGGSFSTTKPFLNHFPKHLP